MLSPHVHFSTQKYQKYYMKNVTSGYLRIAEFGVTVSSLIKCFTTSPCYSKNEGEKNFLFPILKKQKHALKVMLHTDIGQHKNI